MNIEKVLEIYRLNKEKNKWLANRTLEELLENLCDETRELKEAVEEGDKKKITEETSDIFLDALNIIAWISLKYRIDEKDVLEVYVRKKVHRQPWLYWDKELSEEEQLKIWNKQKKKELK